MPWWLYLAIAIIGEVIATTHLKLSDGFTRPIPILIMVVSFVIAFWSLSIVVRIVPIGLIYAIWSGVGIVLIALVGRILFDQKIDIAGLLGIALIVMGVIVIGVFSHNMDQPS